MVSLVDKYFSQADFDAIEAAVKKAESGTSGEIAVELASHSRNWQSEKIVHALIFGVLCLLGALYLTRESNWGIYYDSTQAVLWGGIGFLAAYFGWGAFLKRAERRREVVWKRALKRFSMLEPSRGLTGVLIYISLEEEQAAIVADKGIASKVPSDYWNGPHTALTAAMKAGKHSEGIIQAVEIISIELSRHFPRQGDDVNEFPDRPKEVD